jgi:hypothetical protein
MTSKFRRNTDRALLNHLNDYQDIRKDVNVVQDTTTNPTILNIINPAFGDLDLNNKDILNCDDIETKTINSKIPLYNPSISFLDMASKPIVGCSSLGTNEIDGGNLLIRSQGPMIIESINDDIQINNNINFTAHDLYDIKSMSGLSISARDMQSDIAGAVSFNSDLDMKTNNIVNVGTINGAGFLTNPLTSSLNCSTNDITNAGTVNTVAIKTDTISSDSGMVNIRGDFLGNNLASIYDLFALRTNTSIINSLSKNTTLPGTSINVLSTLDLKTNNNIIGVQNIACSTINGIAPSSFVVSPLSAPLNANGYTISNVGIINTNAITTNSITSAAGMVDIRGDFLGNNLASIYDLFALRTNTAIVNSLSKNTTLPGTSISVLSTLDLKTNNNIIGVQNIETKDLKTTGTITSAIINNSGTVDITGETTLRNKLKLNAPNFLNQIEMTDNLNTVWGDAIGFISIAGAVGGAHMTMGSYGTTADENGIIVNPPNQNITLQTNTQYARLYSNGEFKVGSGVFRVGDVIQDSKLTAYGQFKQVVSGAPTVLAVPLTPNAPLQLTFNTILTPHNVQNNASSITILHAGTYRTVVSVVGIMSGDRELNIYLRKNGIVVSTVFLSRLGSRSVEASINEFNDMIIGDVIDVAIQAQDQTFNFTYYTGILQVERIRKNNL